MGRAGRSLDTHRPFRAACLGPSLLKTKCYGAGCSFPRGWGMATREQPGPKALARWQMSLQGRTTGPGCMRLGEWGSQQ